MPNKKHIGIVKRKLWQHGYRVTERSREVEGFDLLVEEAIKVKVLGGRTPDDVDLKLDGCDVIATVLTATFGKALVGYFVVGNASALAKPSEAFGTPLSKTKSKNHGKKTRKSSAKEVANAQG